jgi:UMF1 family MFS transporter
MMADNRKERLGWYFFDFANTSFTVMIVTVAYAVYFRDYVVGDLSITLPWGSEEEVGTFLWGLGNAISMLLVGITSPYLGAISDSTARKKLFTGLYTALCIIATVLMVTVGEGEVLWGLLLFILGNIGFQGGLIFYNAFLPQISPKERLGYVSGVGFAWGYVGALLTLGLALPFASRATALGDTGALAPAFAVSALFFLIFCLPFFLWVREREPAQAPAGSPWREGWTRVSETLTHLKDYRQTARFLLAYFVYSDGINTVIAFGGIYATETLGFSATQVILFFAILQLAAIAGAWWFGHLTDRLGARPTIEITLAVWIAMTIVAFFAGNATVFYVAGILAGIAMGSSQAASRALMAELTPASREGEFYGFYGLCGKFSAILGPLVYGLVAMLTGSQRWAVLSVGVFFATGWILLRLVDVEAGRASVVSDHTTIPNPDRQGQAS